MLVVGSAEAPQAFTQPRIEQDRGAAERLAAAHNALSPRESRGVLAPAGRRACVHPSDPTKCIPSPCDSVVVLTVRTVPRGRKQLSQESREVAKGLSWRGACVILGRSPSLSAFAPTTTWVDERGRSRRVQRYAGTGRGPLLLTLGQD